jgi:predicted  nucleic acid-binding Zn-ribbon protein
MHWTGGFNELFNVEYNQISLKDEVNYRGYTLVIEDDFEDDDDEELSDSDIELSTYVLYFDVITPDGTRLTIKSSENDNEVENIYLHQDLIDYMNSVGVNDDGVYELDMNKMKSMQLFVIDVKNNELSRTMKSIKNIIDNKKSTKSYDRNSILADFIKTNLSGNIKINSVHFEILLMNQMRSGEDYLELPEWNTHNVNYQILTLNESLRNSRSISVRLQASQISRSLVHSSNRRLKATSNMDVFAMEQPQKFIGNEYQKSTYQLRDGSERKTKKPFIFVTKTEDTEEDPDILNNEE